MLRMMLLAALVGLATPAAAQAPSRGVELAQAGNMQGFIETTETRFARLERQVRELTGRVEELGHRVEQLTRALENFQGDVEDRGRQGGRSDGDDTRAPRGQRPNAATPTPPVVPRATPNVPAPLPPREVTAPIQLRPGELRMVLVPGPPGRPLDPDEDPQSTVPLFRPDRPERVERPQAAAPAPARPEDQYEAAYAQVRQAQQGRGDFTRAEQAMRDFVQANASHRLAGDARYWAGEMAYRRRDYRAAAGHFAEGLERSPNGGRAPDTMLRLAQTLAAQNQRTQACGLLGLMGERYPRASTAIKTQAQQERQRLRCPA